MTIRLLALLLLLGSAFVNAAPPATSALPANDIDVDAMARAKDVSASPPLSDDPTESTGRSSSSIDDEPAHSDPADAPGHDAVVEATPQSPSTASARDDIDVDALARAKDVDAAPSASQSTPGTDDEQTEPATEAPVSADGLDLDAMARAKDVGASAPEDSEPDAASNGADTVELAKETSVDAGNQGQKATGLVVDEPGTSTDVDPSSAIDKESSAEEKPVDAGTENVEATPPTDPVGTTNDAADSLGPEESQPEISTAAPVESAPPVEPTPLVEPTPPVEAAPPVATADDKEKQQAQACDKRAKSLLDAAQHGDYKSATRDFDAAMSRALPASQFKIAWESLAQFGALQTRGQSHFSRLGGVVAVTIPLVFEKANLLAQIACDDKGRIAGFHVKPLESPVP